MTSENFNRMNEIIKQLKLSQHRKIKPETVFLESTKELLLLDFKDLYKPSKHYKSIFVLQSALVFAVIFLVWDIFQKTNEKNSLKDSLWLFNENEIGVSSSQIEISLKNFNFIDKNRLVIDNSPKTFVAYVNQDTQNPEKFEKVIYNSDGKVFSFNFSDGSKNQVFNSDYFYYPYSSLNKKDYIQIVQAKEILPKIGTLNRNFVMLLHSFLNDFKHENYAAGIIAEALISEEIFENVTQNGKMILTQTKLREFDDLTINFQWFLDENEKLTKFIVWSKLPDVNVKIFEAELKNNLVQKDFVWNVPKDLEQNLGKIELASIEEFSEKNNYSFFSEEKSFSLIDP